MLDNPRWELFALEYVITGNALQSALKAGYSEKSVTCTSSRLLDNARITARIAELRAPLENPPNTKIASEKERREKLSEIIRKPIQENVQTKDIISATDKLNLMEHIYEPGKQAQLINVVFVVGEGYRQLVEGKDATK